MSHVIHRSQHTRSPPLAIRRSTPRITSRFFLPYSSSPLAWCEVVCTFIHWAYLAMYSHTNCVLTQINTHMHTYVYRPPCTNPLFLMGELLSVLRGHIELCIHMHKLYTYPNTHMHTHTYVCCSVMECAEVYCVAVCCVAESLDLSLRPVPLA
jgi:hypothetical protein